MNRSALLHETHSPNRIRPYKLAATSYLILLGLLLPILGQRARATCINTCLTGANTAEGENALLTINNGGQSGSNNTGMGASALYFDSAGSFNVAMGTEAMLYNQSGNNNTAVGSIALQQNTTGSYNTAIGANALMNSNTNNNTAVGDEALFSNTASDTTAVGFEALYQNTAGQFNTAVGTLALANNVTGSGNTALGFYALGPFGAGGGNNNTALGTSTLLFNSGNDNTATGQLALSNNSTGSNNSAFGSVALYNNTGFNNTAVGEAALGANTVGNYNTASGQGALSANVAGSNNTANGQNALKSATGSNNIGLGSNGGAFVTNGINNIEIGNNGVANDTKVIRIGKTQTRAFIAGLVSIAGSNVKPVVWDTVSQQLGWMGSSARFKEAIKPMNKTSEAILALQPVTFRYKKEIDPEKTQQFGLVAEEVEKVNPELVTRDEQGKPDGVRYEAVNAMLLNEFLKEHRKVEAQERELQEDKASIALVKTGATKQDATISQLRKDIEILTASLKDQAAQIQKVSAELAVNRPAPRVVAADQ